MKGIIKVSAVLLAVFLLAAAGSEVAYARGWHHTRSSCTTEHAACYQDGVCLEDGSCDVDGVCQYGGNCAGVENIQETYDWHHHSRRSHRSGCHH